MNNDIKNITPVAYIKTDFKEKFGLPRQSGRAKNLMGEIFFKSPYCDENFIRGIEDFSHLWLVFGFSKAFRDNSKAEKTFSPTVRPPRLGGNKRVGVFASRSPFRPNGLGISCVKLERVEKRDGQNILIVSGIDLLDNTPIYDIKPYIPYADSKPDAVGGYAEENREHKLNVIFPKNFSALIPKDKLSALISCLEDDPRPSYQTDPKRVYKMNFSDFEIQFTVSEETLTVINVEPFLESKNLKI